MKATAARISTYTFLVLTFSIALIAQGTTASLSGVVKDQAGKPVPNAKVSLKNVSTGQTAEPKQTRKGTITSQIGRECPAHTATDPCIR